MSDERRRFSRPLTAEQVEPCGCQLCIAMLELAADINRNLRAEIEGRKMRVVQPQRRKRAA